jgi:hypothetical protein
MFQSFSCLSYILRQHTSVSAFIFFSTFHRTNTVYLFLWGFLLCFLYFYHRVLVITLWKFVFFPSLYSFSYAIYFLRHSNSVCHLTHTPPPRLLLVVQNFPASCDGLRCFRWGMKWFRFSTKTAEYNEKPGNSSHLCEFPQENGKQWISKGFTPLFFILKE